MARPTVITLDAGTGGGRAVAVDCEGRIRARAYRAWGYTEPPGLEMISKVFDPARFKSLLAECCREVMAQIAPADLAGVTTTGMRQGCVFLDRDGRELYAGSNHDVRGLQYALEVEEQLGRERTCRIAGRWPPWLFLPARWRWFKEEDPALIVRTARILMINDWLTHWLCGEAAGEPTNAAETMVFDVDRREWSPELLEAAGIAPGLLPRVAPCGTVAGEVSRAAAEFTGLPPGVPVLTGMADTQAGLVAAGVLRPGQAGIVAGTTAPLMVVMDQPRRDPAARVWVGCHPAPGQWVAESNAGDAGIIYRQYVEGHLGRWAAPGTDVYARVEELAREAGPGAAGARAFMGPIIWDLQRMTPAARAGIFMPYPPTEHNAGPGAFARAILENIALALRANLDQAAELAGRPPRIALAGGMTRTRLFPNILASVLGLPIDVAAEPEATAAGCAMTAFTGLGMFPDLESAARAMSAPPRTADPDPDDHDEYDDLYEDWREQYDLMMGLAGE